MVQGSMLVICHCRRVLLDAVQWRDTFVGVTFTATLIQFVTTVLVYENDDKFDCRKFIRAADEKLIINKLWPYLGNWNAQATQLHSYLISEPHGVNYTL